MKHDPILPEIFDLGEIEVLKELFGEGHPPADTSPAAGRDFAETVVTPAAKGLVADAPPDLLIEVDGFEFTPGDGAPEGPGAETVLFQATLLAGKEGMVFESVPLPEEASDETGILENAGNGRGRPAPAPNPGDGGTTDPVPQATFFWEYTFGRQDTSTNDYYNIEVRFEGTAAEWGATFNADTGMWGGGLIDAFIGSAEFLTSMIASGYDSATYLGSWADRQSGAELTERTADDLVIEAYVSDIDGVGGILGRAGAYAIPDADGDDIYEGMPTAGLMEFDLADAQNLLDGVSEGGLWNDVVLHEMMHVMGFGSFWGEQTEGGFDPGWDTLTDGTTIVLDNGTKKPTDDNAIQVYFGAAANAEAAERAGEVVTLDDTSTPEKEYYLAIEGSGGAGTAGSHWDEEFYDDEIMTGYINSLGDGTNSGANYLADFTVAAFTDLGYDVAGDYDLIAAAGSEFLATGEFVDTWTMVA